MRNWLPILCLLLPPTAWSQETPAPSFDPITRYIWTWTAPGIGSSVRFNRDGKVSPSTQPSSVVKEGVRKPSLPSPLSLYRIASSETTRHNPRR